MFTDAPFNGLSGHQVLEFIFGFVSINVNHDRITVVNTVFEFKDLDLAARVG